jgi:hypothetical protein
MVASALKLGRSPRNTTPTVVDDPGKFAKIHNSIKRLLDDEQKRLETKALPQPDQTDR